MLQRVEIFDLGDNFLIQLFGVGKRRSRNAASAMCQTRPVGLRRLSNGRDDAHAGHNDAMCHLRILVDELLDGADDFPHGLEFRFGVVGIVGDLDIEFFFQFKNQFDRTQ